MANITMDSLKKEGSVRFYPGMIDNEIFITPYTRSTLCLLLSAGFHRSYFYVPFSNGNYPKFEQAKWNQLLEEARLNPFTRN